MIGRAGRAGIDTSGESILIVKDSDKPKVRINFFVGHVGVQSLLFIQILRETRRVLREMRHASREIGHVSPETRNVSGEVRHVSGEVKHVS